MKPSKSLHNRLIRHLREWHRKLGIIAAFFIIFLSITGVALNHTTTLSLAHKPISNVWLLDHYGIAPPNDIRFYQHSSLQVTNNLVWLDGKLLLESSSDIVSAGVMSANVSNDTIVDVFVIVSQASLYIYNNQGELLDQLGVEAGIPEGIEALSIDNDLVIVKTASGYYQSDSDFLYWQAISPLIEPLWISPQPVSLEKEQQAALAYRSQFLTIERIILDAHSGRILGLVGVLFMDMVAILLILLSLSGVYIWIRYAKNKR
ncbi:PepSY domain-containing protein [Candidatus Colwellia aromaticivorans]|uniref:PepSY domain-containing protein n=1 Tax=Candidatus Colwellia aromaticivorans TaxID=2267621 RepID=UPI000DF3034B|nr:PepSY domain-containing protein [Candidatus Colwellia aromaticivorans]